MCPPKKSKITFFHFYFYFFSAVSYLIRLYLASWVDSSDNSVLIPLTHFSTLLDVALSTEGLHCRI